MKGKAGAEVVALIAILCIIAIALAGFYFFVQPKAPSYADEQVKTGCKITGDSCEGLLNGYSKCCSAFRCKSPNPLTGGTCSPR